jgi:hypothetical protein
LPRLCGWASSSVGGCDGCGCGTPSVRGDIVIVASGRRKIAELSDEDLDRTAVKSVVAGEQPLRKLFSK